MTNDQLPSISIKLSPTQIDEVLRAASSSRAPSLSALITESLNFPTPRPETPAAAEHSATLAENVPIRSGYLPSDTDDPRLSRSLMRGLSILTGFGPDGAARGIVELAADLGMSASTAHRYAITLVELGLLERCPNTRKYRLPGSGA